MSQQVIIERGCIEKIGEIISKLGVGYPLVVTGTKSYTASGAKKRIEGILGPKNFERFEVRTSLPEISEIERGIKFFKKDKFDAIITIGGGNVLDTAKLIRFLSSQEKPVVEAIKTVQSIKKPSIPLIALPTTAGSGAEATHFSVLYIEKKKHSIAHPGILPDFALVDSDLCLSGPPKLAATSGMDALAQGIESYWSNNSTEESKHYAKQAISLGFESLIPAVCHNDIKARENMSRCALLAGQAINISKTTAPHAVSYILTADYGVPHGQAVGLTLGEFFKHLEHATENDVNDRRGKNFVLETLGEICTILNAANATAACNNLNHLMSTLGLSIRLSEFGIRTTEIAHIIDNVNTERLANHPRRVSRDALSRILLNIA